MRGGSTIYSKPLRHQGLNDQMITRFEDGKYFRASNLQWHFTLEHLTTLSLRHKD